MGKLLLYIVTYSYLIFPLLFLLIKGKFKETILLLLAFYGLAFFCLIFFNDHVPKSIYTFYQAFYTLLEYLFFTYFIWLNIRNIKFKKFIVLASVLFIIFQLIFVTTTGPKRLDSIPIGIETILVFIFIFFFFFEFSKNTREVFIYNLYSFWIAVGVMIYLGGSFFFYILANYLDKEEADKFINMTWVAEIIKNLFFVFSIFMYKKFPANKIHNLPKKIPNLDMV
jgi:hypothetical protein